MKKIILIVLLSPMFVGCRTFKKMIDGAESRPPAQTVLPDTYTVEGISNTDYPVAYEIRCIDSLIRVWVKAPGSSDYRELNRYEFKVNTVSAGGGSVWFRKEAHAAFDDDGKLLTIQFTSNPVARNGTLYRIESSLISQSTGGLY